MLHETSLVFAIVMSLCLAFLFGAIAHHIRVSPLVGYLLAGIIAGPHTPGFYADLELTNQLAEIGIILLMFGVGLNFSIHDLLSVRSIAIPGAILQMILSTFLGMLFSLVMGWNIASGLVFGLALSTASTVLLVRTIQEKDLIGTERGRIAIGWLVVEDMAIILILVLLPALAKVSTTHNLSTLPSIGKSTIYLFENIGFTIGKAILFIGIMIVAGKRIIPWMLKTIAQTGSRELFSLSVLVTALGVAFGAANIFGVSLALGAFFAGMIMNESDLSHRATEEILPLRDAFAVLFFVSVGMLFNPLKLFYNFIPLFCTLFIIIIGKSCISFFIVRYFRYSIGTALTISAGLSQIGEFSFILAGIGINLKLINDDARDLILSGAIFSILLNPFIFFLAEKLKNFLIFSQKTLDLRNNEDKFSYTKKDHTIIIGFNSIGHILAQEFKKKNVPFVIIEDNGRTSEKARKENFEIITGDAVHYDILENANISDAKKLILTMDNTFESGKIASLARRYNKKIFIIAHVSLESESKYLLDSGINSIIAIDRNIANSIINNLSNYKNKQ